MKTRKISFREYGFEPGEEKRLKEYCRKSDFNDHTDLINAALSANPSIANDLYYSIVTGLSYDKIGRIRYIPITKVDFYGYQRKCLNIFRNFLLMQGKW